jgi:hypothetical protein
MAFKLERQNEGTWEGESGATVTLDIRSEQPAQVVRIVYAGKEDNTSPFQFNIRKNLAAALVIALGVKNGQEVEIHEVDGVRSQVQKPILEQTAVL